MHNDNTYRTVQLIDTTLRDGAQAPDVSFSYNDKFYIVKMLASAGIRLFEAGIPAMGRRECEDIADLITAFPQCTFSAWCRADIEDIKKACISGCKSIHISFPVSAAHMSIIGMKENTVIDKLKKLCQFAAAHSVTVSVGAQDASRADPVFLIKFVNCAYESGAIRVRIADTVGILSPVATYNMVSIIRKKVPECPVEFHGHNDLGMATANTLTALHAGAEFASVTVNGLGERTGNAPLEEVVMAIRQASSMDLVFETNELNRICHEVAAITHREIPTCKPVTGNSIFTHESGIHCNGQLKNASAYEPYDPLSTGHKPSHFVSGTHSGKSGIMAILNDNGIVAPSQTIAQFIEIVRTHAVNKGMSLNEKETVELFRSSFS